MTKTQADHPERQYLRILEELLKEGDYRQDRTGTGTLAKFGTQMRFDLSDGTVPIFTTKRVYWKTAAKELLWFLTGDTNIRKLVQANCGIWTDWPLDKYRKAVDASITQEAFEQRIVEDKDFALRWGDLGPVYGKQWRRWLGPDGREHDQIADVVGTLKSNPYSRRILFHGWNVGEIESMALPPCHLYYQFFADSGNGLRGVDAIRDRRTEETAPRRKLSMILMQRSVDTGLGLSFNVCNASLLLLMVAQQADMDPGELIWIGGDTHLYANHVEMAQELVSREPRPFPKFRFARKPDSIDGYRIEDFVVEGYDPHPPIKADVSV